MGKIGKSPLVGSTGHEVDRGCSGDRQRFTAVECLTLAEAVEKVPESRNLKIMIQNMAFDRINVTDRVAVMNDPYENYGCSDFFNSLG
jgi:hypothetical protein